MKQHRSICPESGFNLIEVLIATALLGTVVLAIMGLFFSGQFNVYGGKQMSQAIAVGTHVIEDLQPQSMDGVRTIFGVADNAATSDVDVDTARTLPNDTYEDSILRKSNSIGAGEDPRGYLARWQNEIDTNEKLGSGYVALVMTPLNPRAGALTPGTATLMRLRVVVRWQENGRWRQVVLDSLKIEHA